MNLNLTKKESKLLDDVFIYMIDYINDDCFSNSDRKSFDSIYSKLKSVSDKLKPKKTKLIKSDITEVKKL